MLNLIGGALISGIVAVPAPKPHIKLSPELTQDYGHPIYVCHMDGTDFSGWGRSFKKAYANWKQATQIWYRGKHNV